MNIQDIQGSVPDKKRKNQIQSPNVTHSSIYIHCNFDRRTYHIHDLQFIINHIYFLKTRFYLLTLFKINLKLHDMFNRMLFKEILCSIKYLYGLCFWKFGDREVGK